MGFKKNIELKIGHFHQSGKKTGSWILTQSDRSFYGPSLPVRQLIQKATNIDVLRCVNILMFEYCAWIVSVNVFLRIEIWYHLIQTDPISHSSLCVSVLDTCAEVASFENGIPQLGGALKHGESGSTRHIYQHISIHHISTYITLHCIALHYITSHYTTLHCTTLHYTTLHYMISDIPSYKDICVDRFSHKLCFFWYSWRSGATGFAPSPHIPTVDHFWMTSSPSTRRSEQALVRWIVTVLCNI